MPTFLIFSDISLFQVFLAKREGLSLLRSISEADYLFIQAGLKKESLSSWSELRVVLNPEADLFALETELGGDLQKEVKTYLIDYKDLDLEEKNLDYLTDFFERNKSLEVFLYSSTRQSDKFLADEKKEFKKAGFGVLELNKVEDGLAQQVLVEYIQKAETQGSKIGNYEKDFLKLIKQMGNYYQIVDMLDMFDLVEDGLKKQVLQSFEVKEEPLLFMLGFNLKNLEKDVLKWNQLVSEEEVQLALSLILGKLEKQVGVYGQEQVLEELVLADQRMKTLNVDMMTIWKYFLWRARKIVQS